MINKTLVRNLLVANGFEVTSLRYIHINHEPYSRLYRITLTNSVNYHQDNFIIDTHRGTMYQTEFDEERGVGHHQFICNIKEG